MHIIVLPVGVQPGFIIVYHGFIPWLRRTCYKRFRGAKGNMNLGPCGLPRKVCYHLFVHENVLFFQVCTQTSKERPSSVKLADFPVIKDITVLGASLRAYKQETFVHPCSQPNAVFNCFLFLSMLSATLLSNVVFQKSGVLDKE